MELEKQPFKLFTRIEAYSFGQLPLLETFLGFKVSVSLVALSIPQSLWSRTGLTVAINLYTHIFIAHSSYLGGALYGKVVLK